MVGVTTSQRSVWIAPGAEADLPATVMRAWDHSPAQRRRLDAAGIDPAAVRGLESLQALPVMRKEDLGTLQAGGRPFGGLLGVPMGDLARIFVSPGEIYDPQGARPDYWRFGAALAAAGFRRGQVVINCFSYHLSPAGFIFDDAARSLGCVVIPAGVGQQDLQLKVMAETGATGFMGLPSYLLGLLEKAAEEGRRLALRQAFVTAEPLPPALRARIASLGVEVLQGYGTADLGLVGYECQARNGMHLEAGAAVEICDPTGRPVPAGEVGEVVVTLLEPTYPLLRFATGDLSALMTEPCPCGRLSPRMRGWLGRANDVVKVRGLFLYPRQLEDAMAQLQGRAVRWQAEIDRDERFADRLSLRVEVAADALPLAAAEVAEAVKAATRLTAAVTLVPPGSIPADAPRLADRRAWE